MTWWSGPRRMEGRWRGGNGPGTSVPLTTRARRTAGRAPAGGAPVAGLAVSVVALLLAACTAAPSFDPSGPCDADGRAAGAYPALEAGLPGSLAGRAPETVDSGRSCSADALGSLVRFDVAELRFAGAVWDEGAGSGTSIAILALPDAPLPAAWVEDFYETGARTARRTEKIETSRPEDPVVGPVFRLDTLNELSFQTVIVWSDGDVVRVVIVASPVGPDLSREAHDARLAAGIAVAATAPDPAPASGGALQSP